MCQKISIIIDTITLFMSYSCHVYRDVGIFSKINLKCQPYSCGILTLHFIPPLPYTHCVTWNPCSIVCNYDAVHFETRSPSVITAAKICFHSFTSLGLVPLFTYKVQLKIIPLAIKEKTIATSFNRHGANSFHSNKM